MVVSAGEAAGTVERL